MEHAEIAGTIVLAVSGVFAVVERRLDWFGAVVVGVVTALGGGTVRDTALGIDPAFWVADEAYLVAAIGGATGAVGLAHIMRRSEPGFDRTLRIADAAGLALFSYVGAEVTLELGHGPFLAVVMAVLTGVGGGLIRDVLAGRTPLVLTSEIYATAALAGATAYVALVELTGVPAGAAAAIGMAVTLTLRLVSLYREWSLPLVGEWEARSR